MWLVMWGGQFEQVVAIVGGLFSGQEKDSVFDMAAFTSAAINLSIVIFATFALFIIVRRLAKPLFTKLSGWAIGVAVSYPNHCPPDYPIRRPSARRAQRPYRGFEQLNNQERI